MTLPPPPPDPLDPALAEDWITIWQSELAALAADRELQEAGQRAVDAWAAQARAVVARLCPARQGDDPARAPGADAPPRPAPAGTAPERDAELDELRARLAECERLLAELGAGLAPAVARGGPRAGARNRRLPSARVGKNPARSARPVE